jgi:antirestriction protein
MKDALLEHIEENQRQVTMELGHKDTAFFIYLDNIRQPFDDLWRNYVEEFEDSYAGYFESRSDFYEDMADQIGLLNIESVSDYSNNAVQTLIQYFDMASWGRDLMHDYWETDGHYFRSY